MLRRIALLALAVLLSRSGGVSAQDRHATPLRQSELTRATATVTPLTLRQAARNDRFLGLGVRDVRWAPDGSGVYFRWKLRPSTDDVPEEDPWFRTDPTGSRAWEVSAEEAASIPAADVRWDATVARATWVSGGRLHLFDGDASRAVVSLEQPIRDARFTEAGRAIDFESGEALYRYRTADGSLTVLARRVTHAPSSQPTLPGGWRSTSGSSSPTCARSGISASARPRRPASPTSQLPSRSPRPRASASIGSSSRRTARG